ncbi:MAG: hypothetical protein ABI995_15350 [Acidobacteriota bacterium]
MRTYWSAACAAVLGIGLLWMPTQAQTPGPGKGKGKGKGTAAPSMPAPRNKDGRVIFGPPAGGSGFWGGGGSLVGKGASNLATNLALEDVPFQPWAKALYEVRRSDGGQKDDPHVRCMPPGGPRQFQTPNGFEFLEQPDIKRMYVVFGGGPRSWRVIYLDGRALPKMDDDFVPTYLGYSSGHWEGDTLVVESTGYNEKFWFHRGGLPHTDALHLTERFSRPDFDTLKYEVTVDDVKAYTKPWSGGFTVPWTYTNWDGSAGGEIQEYFCQDYERDTQSFQK